MRSLLFLFLVAAAFAVLMISGEQEALKAMIEAKMNQETGWYSRCSAGTGETTLCQSGCCWGTYNATSVSSTFICLSNGENCATRG